MGLVNSANSSCLRANRIGLDSGIKDGKMWIQTGDLEKQGTIVELINATREGIGLLGVSVTSYVDASESISVVDKAIDKVSQYRSELGAAQRGLEHTKCVDDVISENTSSAESLIRDTDMADEMVNYSKSDILAKAGQAILAQANDSALGVLKLIE